MDPGIAPREALAKKTLPKPLLDSLHHVFEMSPEGCMLVGGTALAGFYAGHRRSDDMDLITRDELSQSAAVRAVQSLSKLGAAISQAQHTPSYYRSTIQWKKHAFTADVVLDGRIHEIGKTVRLKSGVVVADLNTLLAMKAATLVSRAGEKDLYDLVWILGHFPEMTIEGLIQRGQSIDGGVTAENLLISLSGAELNPEACNFAIDPPLPPAMVLRKIQSLKRGMLKDLRAVARKQPLSPLGALIRQVRARI